MQIKKSLMKNKRDFSPLIFLSPLGAGGISVAFFVLINYTIDHGKGLINFTQTHEILSGPAEIFYSFLEVGMLAFILFHLVLTFLYLPDLFRWLKTEGYKNFIKNPLTNSGILAPFISITMTMNVFLASVRYFVPQMAENLQSLMLPGLIAWSLIWVFLMRIEVKLLKTSFTESFDMNKINFGWLLHPFALGMVSVTGAGIAAMSQTPALAHIAFFMLLVSGSMGLFLLIVKTVALFKSHFVAEGLPEKQFLPSLLIIVPNITLYALIAFRVGHYLQNNFDVNLNVYYMIVMTTAFAFQTWYLIFGISLLKDYLNNHFRNEYHVSQWGLVCPFVAYVVLGAFVYATFWTSPIFLGFLTTVILVSLALFFNLLKKQITLE